MQSIEYLPVTCMSAAAHLVQFFSADERLVDAVSRFLRDGLEAGETCIVVATPEHREQIAGQLLAAGLDTATLTTLYRYIELDAHQMLTIFCKDGPLDHARFHRDCGQLLRQAASRGQPVRIFGEMVSLLIEAGQPETAIELEELWNELSRAHDFQLFCAYPHSEFTADPRNRQILHGVHSHVLCGEV